MNRDPSRLSRPSVFRGQVARWTERLLWSAGAAALAYCGFLFVSAAYEQRRGDAELSRILASPAPAAAAHLTDGDLVGRVHIPRLNLSAIVFEGTTDDVLDKGVGHLAASAFPADTGNVVLAAHRDTFFRSLKDIREGDRVNLETPSGRFSYRVHGTKVVSPTAVQVIQPTKDPTLTLITCYPFSFFGNAPERFIVFAQRVK